MPDAGTRVSCQVSTRGRVYEGLLLFLFVGGLLLLFS